jgi:hypothetical protein
VQLVGPTAGPPCLSPRTVDGLDGVHQGRQRLTVVDIGRREPDCVRRAKVSSCFDSAELTLACPGCSPTRAFVVGAQSRTDPHHCVHVSSGSMELPID